MFFFFNKNLRYLRMLNNFSQSELANKLDLSTGSIKMIEMGKRNASIETLHRIKMLFNISIDRLIYVDLSEENNLSE